MAIGVLVTFMNLAHFIGWRAVCGDESAAFSIGFGRPSRCSAMRWRGTEWSISPIPLGGYVKMLDEREMDVPAHERHLALMPSRSAGAWRCRRRPAGQSTAGGAAVYGAVHVWRQLDQSREWVQYNRARQRRRRALRGGEVIATVNGEAVESLAGQTPGADGNLADKAITLTLSQPPRNN